MPELSGQVLETLWEDEEFGPIPGRVGRRTVSRSWPPRPRRRSLRRKASHGCSTPMRFATTWTPPGRLGRRGWSLAEGRLTLLSEDPGGEPLSRLMGRPWEITSFLRRHRPGHRAGPPP